MNGLLDIFEKKGPRRILIFALIILILYSVKSMMNIILLTFIFAFLLDRLIEFTVKRVHLNRKLLVILLYTVIVGLLTVGVVKYLPIITMEISQIIIRITNFYSEPHDNVLLSYIESVISSNQIAAYLENGFSFLVKIFL